MKESVAQWVPWLTVAIYVVWAFAYDRRQKWTTDEPAGGADE